MKGKQIVAIDVGSTNVVIAVGAVMDDGRVDILGITSEPVQGVNAGRVENSETVGRAVHTAKERIEQELGIKITEAYAGLSGDFIRCEQVSDHVYVQDEQNNGSFQITSRDLENLDRRMQSVKLPDDKEEIITKEPLRFKVDGKEVDEPVGAYGHQLVGIYNFILSDRTMRERLFHCLAKQDIAVKAFVPNALVAHIGVATTEDMDEGAVVINLGGGITDITVLQGGKVRHIASVPMGMNSINGDIRAYGIPSNYVEGLKVNFGSAFVDRTTDDKITFPQFRKGTVRSIRRRNLARIIEERLKDICEWVKKEIKEAGCGSRFAPTVLITGGGAEMQNIEYLFASELGYEDVRSVYPEYGFTDSIHEHMATRAYATVASLLLYGAKRGSCAVAERPKISTPEPQPRVMPQSGYQQQMQQEMPTPPKPTPMPAPEQPKSSNAEVAVPPHKLAPVMPEVDEDSTEQHTDERPTIEMPTDNNTKGNNRFGRWIERLGDMFAGNDKGDDQII